jgi:hypothetical protein
MALCWAEFDRYRFAHCIRGNAGELIFRAIFVEAHKQPVLAASHPNRRGISNGNPARAGGNNPITWQAPAPVTVQTP